MNKAYRHVYKDGIGWVAIAENASSVSSSKGSGTVSSKTKVEVLKNFFDLRNSVVLNNGFLLKGLFAATLFCGVFVGDLKAEVTPDITRQQLVTQMNGNIVYTTNGGDRVARFVKSMDGYIDGEGRGYIDINGQWYKVDSYDERGVITLRNGKRYILPTGTLAREDGKFSEVRFFEFGEKFNNTGKGANKEVVRYDTKEKKWYLYNQADNEKLYAAKYRPLPTTKDEKLGDDIFYYKFDNLQKKKDGTLYKTADGYYVSTATATNAGEQNNGKLLKDLNLIESEEPDIKNLKSPDRLSLVGLDGKSTAPKKYDANDKEVKDHKREVDANKDGTIRLGNVARAIYDDEAINLGQLNERLSNVKADKVPYVSIKSSIKDPGSNYDSDGATGDNAIAIGPNATAGESSVAIGFGAETGGSTIIDEASYNKIKKEIENVKDKYKKAEKLNNQPKMAEFGKRINELEELLKTYDKRYEHNGKLITQSDFDKLSAAEKEQATIKYISNTMYENSVAIGHDAQALANDAVAIGNGAKVIVDGSKKIVASGGVAIGQGSVSNARENKDLKGYKPKAFSIDENSNAFENSKSAWVATNQPFAVGNDEKITRQITGVAAGTKDTDAVNVAQLKQVGFFIQGDIGGKGRIQNEDEYDNNTLNIKTDDNWKNDRTNIVYTGKNLETKSIAADGTNDPATKKPYTSKIKIAMTDTPRFKSITIADENTVNKDGKVVDKSDNSPIELKKFDDSIGFAGENNSVIKLTNLAEGTIGKDSKDAITGGQLQKIIKGGLKFTANSGEHTAELGSTVSVKGAGTDWSNFDNGENIMTNIDGNNIVVGLSKALTNINSITTENKGTLTINAGDNKKYTFGDKTDTTNNVITGSDLDTKLNNYVTTGDDKTAEVTSNDGSVKITSSGDKTKIYDLKLEKSKIEELAGTKDLKDGLDKKANLDASNLTDDTNKNKWKEALGIKNLDVSKLFTAKADGTGSTGIEIGANNDTLNFLSGDNLVASSDASGIKYSLNKALTNINSITTENKGTLTINAGDNKKYTFGDKKLVDTSVITNKDLKEAVKQINTQVGSVNLNIAGDKSTKGSVNLKTETLNINGDGKNITTSVKNGEVKVALNDEINLGKDGEIKTRLGNDGLTITQVDGTKGPSITTKGINAGNKVLTNLASGLDGRTLDDIKKDIEKANGDPTKMPKEASNAATIGDLAEVNSKIANVNTDITNITNTTNNINNTIGGDPKDPNNLIDENGNLTTDGEKALTTNAASGQDVVKNTNIIQAINNINKQGTRFFHVNDGTKPMGTKDGEDTEDSSAGSKGGVSIGIRAEVGQNAKNAIAIGTKSQALAENSIAIGNGNVVKGENSGAIGDPSIINAKNSYSVGNNNKIEASTTSNNFILGNNAEITSSNSVALGESTKVSVEGGVALGARSVSSREIGKESGYDISTDSASTSKDATWLSTAGAVAVGDETQGITRQITGVAAGSQDTDAVNVAQLKAVQKISQSAQWISVNNENNLPKSQAGKGDVKGYTGNNSVAIGPGSTTKIGSTAEGKPLYRENTVSVGGVTKDKNGKNVLTQRTISNVAPGVLDSDAATMGQLRAGLNDVYGKLGEYKKRASAGTASAMAIGNMPQATIPGKGMVSLGSGFYDGQSAMAIGLSKMSDDGKWVFKGSASYDSQEKAGAALSVGFHF